ncbi:MAG: phosphate/phosphite/phosphonate ABC transporter substrate-binding protein [Campylobacterales bacterium]|nr:phosphate/phosphite/phosphonate ABC transporter substrate-binding protein [Campylobacterales bacterium]
MYRIIALYAVVLLFFGCGQEKNTPRYRPEGSISSEHTYIVGIHPYLNSKKTFEAYQPIIDHLQRQIDAGRLVLETSRDYADYEAKLYRGHFDFALPNPLQTLESIKHGYRVVAKMKPDSVFRGIIVARKERHLSDVAQLKGHAVSFPAPTALAATMMPLYFLHNRGLDVHKQIEKRFVGSQYSAILNAYTGDTLAAATWPPPWESWCRENPAKAADMQIVWQTRPLVNNGFVAHERVAAALVGRLVRLLTALDQTQEGRVLLAQAGFDGFETAHNGSYDAVQSFLIDYRHTIGEIE